MENRKSIYISFDSAQHTAYRILHPCNSVWLWEYMPSYSVHIDANTGQYVAPKYLLCAWYFHICVQSLMPSMEIIKVMWPDKGTKRSSVQV